jgi:hypothetical protein
LYALGALQESAEKGPSIPSKPLCKNRPNPQMFLFSLVKWMFVCYDFFLCVCFVSFKRSEEEENIFFLLSKTVREALKSTEAYLCEQAHCSE